MGLDQYLTSAKKSKLAYWRKFGELQNLIEEMWREETGSVDDFNCVDFELTEESCDYIIDKLKSKELPDHTGFFYGSSNRENDEYINDAIKTFEQAKLEIQNGNSVYYSSWW